MRSPSTSPTTNKIQRQICTELALSFLTLLSEPTVLSPTTFWTTNTTSGYSLHTVGGLSTLGNFLFLCAIVRKQGYLLLWTVIQALPGLPCSSCFIIRSLFCQLPLLILDPPAFSEEEQQSTYEGSLPTASLSLL
jgi:hypothetical protein